MIMQKLCQMWVRICVSLFFVYTKKSRRFSPAAWSPFEGWPSGLLIIYFLRERCGSLPIGISHS